MLRDEPPKRENDWKETAEHALLAHRSVSDGWKRQTGLAGNLGAVVDSLRGSNVPKELHGMVSREHVRITGPALAPIRMSMSRFNATLRDGQAYGATG